MALHRIAGRCQQLRQGTLPGQGLAPLGQVGQQPVHGGGAAGAAGVELADAIAGEAQLLLEQLLVLSRNRAGEAHAGGPAGDQLGGLRKSLGPVGRGGRPGPPAAAGAGEVAQPRPDQFAHEAIAQLVGEHGLEQGVAEGEGIGHGGEG